MMSPRGTMSAAARSSRAWRDPEAEEDLGPAAKSVTIPTFLYQVRDDLMTRPSDIQAMYDNIPVEDKKLLWIDGSTARRDGCLYPWSPPSRPTPPHLGCGGVGLAAEIAPAPAGSPCRTGRGKVAIQYHPAASAVPRRTPGHGVAAALRGPATGGGATGRAR